MSEVGRMPFLPSIGPERGLPPHRRQEGLETLLVPRKPKTFAQKFDRFLWPLARIIKVTNGRGF